MSWYYTYYLGYKNDGKIYPYGPFNRNGRLYPCLELNRTSALSQLFENKPDASELSDELLKAIYGENFMETLADAEIPYTEEEIAERIKLFGDERVARKMTREENIKSCYIACLPYKELPDKSSMVEGYISYNQFLQLKDGLAPEDYLTPTEYAQQLQSVVKSGKQADFEYYDESTDDYVKVPIADMMLAVWENKSSIDYEAKVIRKFVDDFYEFDIEQKDLVIIKTEG